MAQAIVEEVLRALSYPKVRKYIRSGLDPKLWFEDIVVLSHLVAGDREFEGVSKDPDDNKYIAAAIRPRRLLWLPEIQTCLIGKSTTASAS
jgi:predicted nucleic acid-binding protein